MDASAETCKNILKEYNTILLIDWADVSIPFSLVKAGFSVFSYSPGQYSNALIENGKPVFKRSDRTPDAVDIVYVYRPEAEHPDIIKTHVLPLHAKVLWLHPPIISAKTAELASQIGLIFIQGIDIMTTLDIRSVISSDSDKS